MNRICALIVVDTEQALAAGSANGCSYLMDTNGFLGSWQEGTASLHTICQDGQTIVWTVSPLSPDGDVSIAGFSGDMVNDGICKPVVVQGIDGPFWQGRIESQGQFASWGYTVTLSLSGTQMNLNSFVKVA